MKAEDKPGYVKEARQLLSSIELDYLIANHSDLKEIGKINRLIAIFTDFSSNDGQELKRLFQEFQKWARRSTSVGTIKNRAIDVLQFIGQKIEDMDIYVIKDPIKQQQERIVKNLKNEKYWVRSSLEGKDLHIIVGERSAKEGEHIHIISDSTTGAIRFDAGDSHPKELLERVVSLITKSGETISVGQHGVRTTMEFIEGDASVGKESPNIYATRVMKSGGPNGHYIYFTLKNVGKEIALDIHWSIKGFDYEWKSQDESFELEPNKEKVVKFQISGEKIFTELVRELSIIMEYMDPGGRKYFTRTELIQERVPSGAFFNLKTSIFHPPLILVEDNLQFLSEPFQGGDSVSVTFGIDTKEGAKKVNIGMSGSLSAILGFTNDAQIKEALLELAHRKIPKMIEENNLKDHIFTTSELPEHNEQENGFELYVRFRDLIV